jgi:hypothetical protein
MLYFIDDETFRCKDINFDRAREIDDVLQDSVELWLSQVGVEPNENVLKEYGVQENTSLTSSESVLANAFLLTLMNRGEKLSLLDR